MEKCKECDEKEKRIEELAEQRKGWAIWWIETSIGWIIQRLDFGQGD